MGWDYESRMRQATECLCKAKAALEKIKECTQQVGKITEEMDDGQYKRMLVDLSASSYQELLRYRDITKELLCISETIHVDCLYASPPYLHAELDMGTNPFETDMLPEDPK